MTGVEWVRLPTGDEFGEAPSRGVVAASDGTNSENYSGAWIGYVNDSIGGAGELAVTISQVGSSVTGTWRAEFATQITGGIVWGEMRGGELLLEMIPSRNDACPYNAVVTREQQIMVGTYAAYNCTIHISGELRLLKQ